MFSCSLIFLVLAAIIFKDADENPFIELADKVAELCMLSGLLVVHTGRESIKLAPTLSITEDALLEGLQVIKDSLNSAITMLQIKN